MANKENQEALDLLMFYPRIIEREGSVNVKSLQKAYSTLQELIDNYKELVNEKCMKCGDFQIITSIEPPTILCKAKGCKWYGK